MCTLSILPAAAWTGPGQHDAAWCVRVAMNRDELRTRPAAWPPEVRRFGRRRALLPVDPVSDGTWIAASDAGLIGAVLNVTERSESVAAPSAGAASRGRILPSLLDCDSLAEAVARAAALDTAQYLPFRLVLVALLELAEVCWDGRRLRIVERGRLTRPRVYASSGLGDALVAGPRRRLFEELVRDAGDPAARQDAFHRHAWPGREHLSVHMHRVDAATVSQTVVELGIDDVRMAYRGGGPCGPAVVSRLPLAAAEVAVR